jgi:DNA segregation ATPase FtsK/SpoIIIE, S-DNA-T family
LARANQKKTASGYPLRVSLPAGSKEAALIVLTAIALYVAISLASYSPSDPGWSHSGGTDNVLNNGGPVGAWLSDVFLYLFGYLAYVFPAILAYVGWLVFRGYFDGSRPPLHHTLVRASGFVLTLAAGSGLATLHFATRGRLPLDAGGILGNLVGNNLADVFSPLGGTLFLLALFFTGMTLFTNISWLAVMDATGHYTLRTLRGSLGLGRRLREIYESWKARKVRETHVEIERKRVKLRPQPRVEPTIARVKPSVRAEKERQVPLFDVPPGQGIPPLSLLDAPASSGKGLSNSALEAISRQVELKLRDFGVEVEVVAVRPGPVITRFELQPAPGVKVSQISNLAKDLARSLSTISVRIVEVIAGKSVIGLEIPNEHRELVALSDIVRSQEYENTGVALTLALGKDIAGRPMVVDLARMPHLLVAGTTGSGKSVAINAMILSILYKSTSTDVRLIMVDPKMLELSIYEGIPHLLAPVVTDMKEAANALRWCVAEMERRYKLMSALGVRNISGYNRKVKEAVNKGSPIPDPLYSPRPEAVAEGVVDRPVLEPLPFIVVIIDELADLMMVAGKKVEELICRLAQKARAAGVHLILATQRPSVDVITGLIKANIPSRIAFQVSSKVDSRTILDQGGAEQLLGHGDMLYLSPGMPAPNRIHGAFVGDHEVHKIVDHLRSSGEPM